MHGVTRFTIKGKLALRYIRPFKITDRIGFVTYHLDLPPQLGRVQNVFHILMLRKYTPSPSHVIQYTEVPIQKNVIYKKQLVRILGRELKVLFNREISLVKVLWKYHKEEKTTKELEIEMYK
ncbi:hypothetical protein PanWU01x14_006440, partial [Parasponia andersonii]